MSLSLRVFAAIILNNLFDNFVLQNIEEVLLTDKMTHNQHRRD